MCCSSKGFLAKSGCWFRTCEGVCMVSGIEALVSHPPWATKGEARVFFFRCPFKNPEMRMALEKTRGKKCTTNNQKMEDTTGIG